MERSLTWIAESIGGTLVGEDLQVDLQWATTDSREVKPGSLYFARRGEDADGHKYLPDAVSHGATAAVVETGFSDIAVPQIVVTDTTTALGKLAKEHLADLRLDAPVQVVGITGSAGKTTTKDLLAEILSQSGPTVAPVRSFNNEVGCPLTILKADRQTRFLVLEMGASGPGHIRYLTEIAPLDVAVELMVGRAHLGGYDSARDLAATKAELVEGLRPGGVAVLNEDDAAVAGMAEKASGRTVFFSVSGEEDALVRATHLKIESDGCPSFVLETPDFRGRVKLRLAGAHQVSNALAAMAANYVLGCSTSLGVRALEATGPVSEHRMDVRSGVSIDLSGRLRTDITIVDDSYNANPDSMTAAFRTVSSLRAEDQRLVMVLGEMLELGQSSVDIHREVGSNAATVSPDVVIGVGAEVGPLLEMLEGVTTKHVEGAPQALAALEEMLDTGDLLLLKGSNGSGVWRVAEALVGQA